MSLGRVDPYSSNILERIKQIRGMQGQMMINRKRYREGSTITYKEYGEFRKGIISKHPHLPGQFQANGRLVDDILKHAEDVRFY